jgi:hypothetical protein
MVSQSSIFALVVLAIAKIELPLTVAIANTTGSFGHRLWL